MAFYVSPEMSVKELIDRKPKLIKMFMALKLNCIGCPIDELHTLADVAKENQLDLDQLIRKVNETLSGNDKKIQNERGD